MRLNDEQRKQVEENHNLIYWYANKRHLDINEWYGLLAIELCKTVMKYDADKGSLGNYFMLRCDGVMSKEYKKSQSQKRLHTEITYIEEAHAIPNTTDIERSYELQEWIESDTHGILQMKADGYTQKEIAEQLNVSQSYVSKIIKRLREEYLNGDR